MRFAAIIAVIMAFTGSVQATPYPADPLESPMWTFHAKKLFGDAPVRFDDRVKLSMPMVAENQRAFPVTLDARDIPGVKRMVIFADLNPIPIAVDYSPTAAAAYIGTRIKLDQRTPVRGAVQLENGQWLVSGGWIDAAGGGCSAPPVSRVKGDWSEHLGEIRGRAWTEPAGGSRLRLSVRHPMDTGLVENIAIYHIDSIVIKDDSGVMVGTIGVQASVSEDPAFTVMPYAKSGESLIVESRDTNGRGTLATMMVEPAPTRSIASR